MMPAVKHFDPILGVDVHIIQPPGPVPPLPIPHPFVGFVIDPFDYVPIVGATVLVNSMPRGQAGTAGKCVPPTSPSGACSSSPLPMRQRFSWAAPRLRWMETLSVSWLCRRYPAIAWACRRRPGPKKRARPNPWCFPPVWCCRFPPVRRCWWAGRPPSPLWPWA